MSSVVIIGGGIIGLSIARRLAQQNAKVTILERERAGRESSWAAAGLLGVQHESITAGPLFELCLASRRIYRAFVTELEEESGIDIHYRDDGTLFPVFNDNERERCDARHSWQQGYGLSAEWLDLNSLRKLVPGASENLLGAYLLPDDHQLDCRHLIDALIASNKELGVTIQEHSCVHRVNISLASVRPNTPNVQLQPPCASRSP